MRASIAAVAGLLALACAPAASGQARPDRVALTAPELDEVRGGFDVPGGLNVTLGVNTFTRIDGREVLQSTFRIADGVAQVGVLANDGGALASVAPILDGAGVVTADGVLRLTSSTGGARVSLETAGTDISHLVGQSLGSIVSNTANDRSIDTVTNIDIGLSGITPDAVGGAMAQVQNLALSSTVLLNH